MPRDLKPILTRIERAPTELGGHPRHLHPALDLKYIQAVLKAETGEHVELLDGWLQRWTPAEQVEAILAHKPDIAIIRAITPCIDESVQVGTALRKAGVITVAIGQQVSHVAYRSVPGWYDAFDIPVFGDPEGAVPALIRRLRGGEPLEELVTLYTEALEQRKPFVLSDPNTLPPPDFTREELARYPFPFPIPGKPPKVWGYVLSAWGCPHRCTHCSGVVRKTFGSHVRVRSPEAIVGEIEKLLDTGAEAIIFEDDTLLCDKRNFLEVCREIERRGLRFPWIAHARPDELDEERVAAAAKSGAVLFKIGVESGSPRVIELLGKCKSGEAWLDHIHNAFEQLHKYDVGAVALLLVGSPGETKEDFEKTVELSMRLKSDYIQVQVYCAYPDSPYYIGLDAEDSSHVREGSQYHYEVPTWTPSNLPPTELVDLQRDFYRRYYLRPGYMLWHFRRFWRYYSSPSTARRLIAGMAAWVAGLRKDSQVGPS